MLRWYQCYSTLYLLLNDGAIAKQHDPEESEDSLQNLVRKRNLVSTDQLFEATPPPSRIDIGTTYSKKKELDNTAGFPNAKLGRILNALAADGKIPAPPSRHVDSATTSQKESPNEKEGGVEPNNVVEDKRDKYSVESEKEAEAAEASVTQAKSPSQIYNEAMEDLVKKAEVVHLPLLDGFNYSLPETPTIGNAAELPPLFEIVGQNLGNSMGSTAGNVFGGTTNLLANYADAMKQGFVSVLGNIKLPGRAAEDGKNLQSEDVDTDFEIDAPIDDSQTGEGVYDYPNMNLYPQYLNSLYNFYNSYYPGYFNPYIRLPPSTYPFYGQGLNSYYPPYRIPDNVPIGAPIPLLDQNLMDKRTVSINNMKLNPLIPPGVISPNIGIPSSSDANPADTVRNQWPLMGTNVGETIGNSVGNSLGNSLATDLNLLHGVANSAAENFFNVFNSGIGGKTVPLDPRALPMPNKNPRVASVQRLLAAINNVENGVGSTKNLDINPVGLNNQPNPNLNLLSSFLNPQLLFGNLAQQNPLQALLLGGLLNNNPQIPATTPKPTPSPTVPSLAGSGLSPSGSSATEPIKNPVQAWNDAVANLTQTTANLGLPTLDGFNATLPELDKVGNGAGLPEISEHLGQNVGNAVGSNVGNVLSGSATLVGSTASNIKDSFLTAMNPVLENIFNIFGQIPSKPLGAQKRRLTVDEVEIVISKCASKNLIYTSSEAASVDNVSSLKECQLICQAYSSPLFVSDCKIESNAENEDDDKVHCLGASFNRATGKCSLYFSILGTYTVEGTDSVPVSCDEDIFIQPLTQFLEIVQSSETTACLYKNNINVLPIPDELRPNVAVPMEEDADLPQLSSFVNEEAEETSIWRYNPDTPVELQDQIVEDKIWQVQMSPADAPAGKSSWGAPSGIADWRYCALLCDGEDECTHWSYIFNPENYEEYSGACTLATNTEPSGPPVGKVQVISGPRLKSFPNNLFGRTDSNSVRRLIADSVSKKWRGDVNRKVPRKLSDASPFLGNMIDPQVRVKAGLDHGSARLLDELQNKEPATSNTADSYSECDDAGFVYYSIFDKNITDFVAPVASKNVPSRFDCRQACESSTNCAAFQYVPQAVLSISARLSASQTQTCILMNKISEKKIPADPTIVSGIVTPSGCQPLQKPKTLTVKAESWVVDEKEDDDDDDQDDDDGEESEDESVDRHKQVSLRGQLITNSTNVAQVENVEECSSLCKSTEKCKAYSWAKGWRGCYLFEDYSEAVPDIDMQSETVNSNKFPTNLESDGSSKQANRNIFLCPRARREEIYSEAHVLANLSDVKTAQACFEKCRQTVGCFYLTYIDFKGIEELTHLSKRSLYDVQPSNNDVASTLCLLFDRIQETRPSPRKLAISTEINCDVDGDLGRSTQ